MSQLLVKWQVGKTQHRKPLMRTYRGRVIWDLACVLKVTCGGGGGGVVGVASRFFSVGLGNSPPQPTTFEPEALNLNPLNPKP